MQATLRIANGVLLRRHARATAFGSAAQDLFTGDCERPSLHRLDRLPVADAAQGLSPCSTVQRYFYEWRAMGLWSRINYHLVMEAWEMEGKEASPTAGAIDSQCVKTTESVGIRGFDAGKTATNCVCAEIKGRKRHIIVDTLGLMVGPMVHSADIQDRAGAPDLLNSIRNRWP